MNENESNVEPTAEQNAFFATCTREFDEKMVKLNRDWSFSNFKKWGFDQASGVFFLELNDASKVEADGQIIGSYIPALKSWEWAWNNPNWAAHLTRDVSAVRSFGERKLFHIYKKGMCRLRTQGVRSIFLPLLSTSYLPRVCMPVMRVPW